MKNLEIIAQNYGLCPSHYLRVLGLSWDAMLKMTKIKLEHISDPDMQIFFQKGTRGAISYISNRYSKANNKYLKSYYPQGRIETYYIPRRKQFIWLCNV